MSIRGLIYRGETQFLNNDTRSSAPGNFIELPDGSVHYELAGSPAAHTVVLVPGFSVPYAIWDPTFNALIEAGFHVLRFDLYGRGYSDRPDIHYNQDLFDRQLINLLDALAISERIDLVGLSLGGAISVIFADRHPERISKLCLIDPAGLPWPQSLPARLGKAPIFGELIMSLLGDKVLISNLADYFFSDEEYAELKEEFLLQMQFIGFKKSLLSTLRSGVTTGAEQAYLSVGKRNLPAMLIWGREDQVVPFELSNKVIELIPKIEFHPIDDAAHIPHYECPETVNPLLIEFLRS